MLTFLEWTLVLCLYIIPGSPLPGPGFFYQIPAVSSCFRVLPEVSICLTNQRFEINDLESLLINAYQHRFEISDY